MEKLIPESEERGGWDFYGASDVLFLSLCEGSMGIHFIVTFRSMTDRIHDDGLISLQWSWKVPSA